MPIGDSHEDRRCGGPAAGIGAEIEYQVVDLRGGIAMYQAVTGPARVYRTDAAVLAIQLAVDFADLVGLRFSCLVTPVEFGAVRSRYRRVGE